MADPTFDAGAVELAKRLHRNFLKGNQNTPFKSDWMEFYEQAARFLGKWNDQG